MEQRQLQSKLLDLWWHRAPTVAARRSRTLPATLADGIYLAAWPVVGAWVPPLALLLGVLIGWLRFAPGDTFTYSIPVLAVMLVFASAGAGVGAWMLVGYAFGDFFLGHPGSLRYGSGFFDALVHVRSPLVISYILLAMLLVGMPLTSAGVRRRTFASLKIDRTTRMILDGAVQAALAAGIVFVWTLSVPTLIRPLWTWQGSSPPVEAIRPIQEHGMVLIVVAAAAAIARVVAEYIASADQTLVRRAVALRAELAATPTVRARQMPEWVSPVAKALFVTFMISGVLTTWFDALIFAAAATCIMLLRQPLLSRIGGWVRVATRVPMAIRIAAGVVASYLIASRVVAAMWNSTSTFRPVTIGIIISLIVFALLLPEAAVAKRSAA